MAGGKLTEAWASVTKSAIAEAILGLTKLPENLRTPTECIKTSTVRMLSDIHSKGPRFVVIEIHTDLFIYLFDLLDGDSNYFPKGLFTRTDAVTVTLTVNIKHCAKR